MICQSRSVLRDCFYVKFKYQKNSRAVIWPMVTVSSWGLNVGSKITCTPGVTHKFGSRRNFQ